MWKALWTNGFTDWKIYNSVQWMNFVHTYHLYLQAQIPSVDASIAEDSAQRIASTSSGFHSALVVHRGHRSVQGGSERRDLAAFLIP